MRPRFMNRGSEVLLPSQFSTASASMRPRFMNRGSKILLEGLTASHPASMRPRFMNRGSQPVSAAPSFNSWGFNEAPIHESGKSW